MSWAGTDRVMLPNGSTHAKRPAWRNPHLSNCALHLRRVCGTCRRFDGAGLRSAGVCTVSSEPVEGPTSAGSCPDWERPVV